MNDLNGIVGEIRKELIEKSDRNYGEHSKKYLKSPFQFYGVKVPELRKIAKKYKFLDLEETKAIFDYFWKTDFHEEKLIAIFLLLNKEKEFDMSIWNLVIPKVRDIKTWDVCDAMSAWVIGKILADNLNLKRDVENLALSRNNWERRCSIVSSYQLIKNGKLDLTFKLAEKLVYDPDIYVQKGAGWMLREAGKKQRIPVREFILMHINMKPTAFSYSIEKMRELREKRKEYEAKMKEKAKEIENCNKIEN